MKTIPWIPLTTQQTFYLHLLIYIPSNIAICNKVENIYINELFLKYFRQIEVQKNNFWCNIQRYFVKRKLQLLLLKSLKTIISHFILPLAFVVSNSQLRILQFGSEVQNSYGWQGLRTKLTVSSQWRNWKTLINH